MTSYQMGDCCVRGVKHEGTARGEIKTLGGVPAYFAYPENKQTDNAILIIPDVFGHEAINVQLLADGFADNGYFTVIPDVFDGNPYSPEKGEIMQWFKGPPSQGPERVDGVVEKSIKDLRSTYSVKRLGAVGYCFGAKYVVRFLGARGKELSATVDVGYSAHPSFVDADELKAIEGPYAISAAETDSIFPNEKRYESEVILKELAQGPKEIAYEIRLFSAVEHGFAVRGDPSKKRARFAKEGAFNQAVEFFNYFLKEGK